eukprot:3940031-Rhodomonas_salina.1
MDGRFPVSTTTIIPWPVLHGAMVDRYLPPDHEIRLQLVFERTVQRTTLLEYMERFQILDSAVLFAGLALTDKNKVLQFLKGLQKHEDR